MKKIDEQFMQMALSEAAKGVGRTSPNPPVGALVVKGKQIVALGHHRKAGGAHAEINALRKAGQKARRATLYVTLEPCSHKGRTPPCVEAIIKAGVRRVVVGMRDPNPLVNGAGLRRLRQQGLEIVTGVLGSECRDFYRPYKIFVTEGRSFVTLKTAISLDGMVATASGESQWLTDTAAREHGHQLRDQVDAILVGRETVLRDDPRLTTRLSGRRKGHDPTRIILDSRLRIPISAKVLHVRSEAPTLLVASDDAPRLQERVLEEEGAEVLRCRTDLAGRIDLEDLLKKLAQRGLMTLVVEGGPTVQASFIRQGMADRVWIYVAMKLVGGKGMPMLEGIRIPSLKEAIPLKNPRTEQIGPDLWVAADL